MRVPGEHYQIEVFVDGIKKCFLGPGDYHYYYWTGHRRIEYTQDIRLITNDIACVQGVNFLFPGKFLSDLRDSRLGNWSDKKKVP